jgi:uncharacterized membrane protein
MENESMNSMPASEAPKGDMQQTTVTVDNSTILGVLAYVGPLVVISYLIGKDIPFVKFHIKQGLIILCIEIVAWLLMTFSWRMWMFVNLIDLITLVLSILGIINVVQHKEKELPVVGQFGRNFKF